ncbi:ATP-grasp domain-containing protein [Kaistella daneshvariae]|uniref:ATP-grasp domain-containing protein n=1 Tax=Kaistella daneshvariae TaxID=2487074 RepID=A0ABN5SW93_9FLAO|nr:ATP-grasp domain-containing protein [Kaistella daneshvariae]AZI66635.1 ATP-grasp domain-containing protein [Kaistella daneshvariae]
MELNILVFPCGSEIALEIHRSLKYSRHIRLYGASSVDDHGKFIFDHYINDVPFFDDPDFVLKVNKIIEEYSIDAIYPAMDSVIAKLSEIQDLISCKIIGSSNETNQICLSKKATYSLLKNTIPIPKIFEVENIRYEDFPLFMKPDVGYGSRGAQKVCSTSEIKTQLSLYPDSIIVEYLPGAELTIDCFTDRFGKLRFYGPRLRQRISNGISVNTKIFSERKEEIKNIIEAINSKITFRGAWFVQVKIDKKGVLTLLEIAARFGGSSSLYRNKGINFSLLSIFDAFDYDVELFQNEYDIELDRALDNKYKLNIGYDHVYVDFDDCLVIRDQVNTQLVSFVFQCINRNKKIILITKHELDIHKTLKKYRLEKLFDEIIHLSKDDNKYKHIPEQNAIFIDDSYKERFEVHENLKIPVFAPDNIEALLD